MRDTLAVAVGWLAGTVVAGAVMATMVVLFGVVPGGPSRAPVGWVMLLGAAVVFLIGGGCAAVVTGWMLGRGRRGLRQMAAPLLVWVALLLVALVGKPPQVLSDPLPFAAVSLVAALVGGGLGVAGTRRSAKIGPA